jgi:hypothetical protein
MFGLASERHAVVAARRPESNCRTVRTLVNYSLKVVVIVVYKLNYVFIVRLVNMFQVCVQIHDDLATNAKWRESNSYPSVSSP